jgi:hypothetical protein
MDNYRSQSSYGSDLLFQNDFPLLFLETDSNIDNSKIVQCPAEITETTKRVQVEPSLLPPSRQLTPSYPWTPYPETLSSYYSGLPPMPPPSSEGTINHSLVGDPLFANELSEESSDSDEYQCRICERRFRGAWAKGNLCRHQKVCHTSLSVVDMSMGNPRNNPANWSSSWRDNEQDIDKPGLPRFCGEVTRTKVRGPTEPPPPAPGQPGPPIRCRFPGCDRTYHRSDAALAHYRNSHPRSGMVVIRADKSTKETTSSMS